MGISSVFPGFITSTRREVHLEVAGVGVQAIQAGGNQKEAV